MAPRLSPISSTAATAKRRSIRVFTAGIYCLVIVPNSLIYLLQSRVAPAFVAALGSLRMWPLGIEHKWLCEKGRKIRRLITSGYVRLTHCSGKQCPCPAMVSRLRFSLYCSLVKLSRHLECGSNQPTRLSVVGGNAYGLLKGKPQFDLNQFDRNWLPVRGAK